jgi:6-phosphogluconolactonase
MLLRLIPVLCAAATAFAAGSPMLMYIGTYTGPKSKGIYVYRFDPASGRVTPIGLAAETPSPSFLAAHPNGRYVYAVNEVNNFEGQRGGSVAAFSVDASSGKLTAINRVSSRGSGPCHLSVDKTGKLLAVANYGSGSEAAFPVNNDGSLGEATWFLQHEGSSVDQKRQRGPHAHCAVFSPDNRFLAVADLGLDRILISRVGADGKLQPNNPPYGTVKPGSGPRHFAFHPGGRWAYVINEMASTITAFDWNAKDGVLKEIATISTLPADFKGENTTAEIEVHPNGKFVYGSNRGHDSIAVFAIDQKNGTLTPVEYVSTDGHTPRGFKIDPSGKYLVAGNQDSNNFVVFAVDGKTGRLKSTGRKFEVGSPVSVVFVPAR